MFGNIENGSIFQERQYKNYKHHLLQHAWLRQVGILSLCDYDLKWLKQGRGSTKMRTASSPVHTTPKALASDQAGCLDKRDQNRGEIGTEGESKFWTVLPWVGSVDLDQSNRDSQENSVEIKKSQVVAIFFLCEIFRFDDRTILKVRFKYLKNLKSSIS